MTVNATALINNTLLTLSGSATFTVTGLKGDLDASGVTGPLTVAAVDNTNDNGISITTGSNTTSITSSAGNDTITVNANALNDGTQLTLVGSADFFVTNLQGDLVASGVTGALTVTTVDVATGLTITTGGNGANSIDATALLDGHALTLLGSDSATVSLKAGDLSAGTYSGALTVNVVTNGAATDTVSITTGTNTTSIAAADTGDAITVNATALNDGTVLTLSGAANFTVTGLKGDLVASGVAGTLNVTTVDVAGLTITTGGTGGNTINASALADGHALTLIGSDSATVSLSAGDLSASTYSGTLTVNVVANSVLTDTVSITTGSNTTSVAAAEAGDAITVNATALADNTQLTLSGAANFTVTGLKGNLDATTLLGTLTVTAGDNIVDNAITIVTGSNTTSITSTAGSDTVTVSATALNDGTVLTLSGAADFVVTGLRGDLVASGVTGALNVTTVDVATGLSITTGGGGGNTINATALTDGHVLTLLGNDTATVSLSAGDLLAGTYSGTLTVNVAGNGVFTDTVSITTGSITTTVTAADAGDAVSVNATALPNNTTLTLSGAASFTVTGLKGNIDASGVSGTLTVTTVDATDNTISIVTGSAATSVNDAFSGDTVTVTATALNDNAQMTLSGAANFTVTGLKGDLDASGVTGALNVTAVAVATGLSITTGGGATNTINATALAAGQTLTLTGSSAVTVTLNAGNLSAGTYGGAITLNNGAGANDITTGSGADIVTLSAAHASGTIDLGTNSDSLSLVGGNTLTVTSAETITSSGNGIDFITLGAAQGSGNINLGGGATDRLDLANGGNTLNISNTEIINGGGGADVITLLTNQTGTTIDLAGGTDSLQLAGGGNTMTVSNTETITGGSGNDVITLNTVLTGGTIDLAGGGNDKLILANGTNSITVNGTEIVVGGTGDDTIVSTDNTATTFILGAGNDTVTGGGGVDQFRLRTDGGTDTINDFVRGTDKIGFLEGSAITGAVDFTTNGNSAGATLGASDFVQRASVASITATDDNKVIVITGGQTSLQIAAATNSATNSYVVVFDTTDNRAEIWFDDDWSSTTGRVQIATLVGVTQADVTALARTDFVVYDTTLGPAGVAGSPINLALDDVSGGRVGDVTVTISDVPPGSSLNAGMDNGDGTWTVQTNDPQSLTITTPVAFTGAFVLTVTQTWTNPDGTISTVTFKDNVEAYAPGAPIFAWSGDDTLTGSSGSDKFVFAQPIGHDTIYNFDVASDHLDLIGFAGITSLADVLARTTTDANGNAVITIGDGSSITLVGVDAASLTAANFEFNQTPVTDNAGIMTIGDGALLPLGGVINNSGTIALNSAGDHTELQILGPSATLQGGGNVTLSGSGGNAIVSVADATLTNVDNTISGAGTIGNAHLTLINQAAGVIDANIAGQSLVIDTGDNTVMNYGVIRATNGGELQIHSNVDNAGLLQVAAGSTMLIIGSVFNSGTIDISGTLYVSDTVSGTGAINIHSGATLELASASSATIVFANDAGTTGGLVLDNSKAFTGLIVGFAGDGTIENSDTIDLKDVAFADIASKSFDSETGTLSLYDAQGHVLAQLTFAGSYVLDNFVIQSDGSGGTLIIDPPVSKAGPSTSQNDSPLATTGSQDGVVTTLDAEIADLVAQLVRNGRAVAQSDTGSETADQANSPLRLADVALALAASSAGTIFAGEIADLINNQFRLTDGFIQSLTDSNASTGAATQVADLTARLAQLADHLAPTPTKGLVGTGSAVQADNPIRITDGFVLTPVSDAAGRIQGVDPQPQPIELTNGNTSTPTNGLVGTGSAVQAANPIRITDGHVSTPAGNDRTPGAGDHGTQPIELTNGNASTPTAGIVETGSAVQAANPIRITDGYVLAPINDDAGRKSGHRSAADRTDQRYLDPDQRHCRDRQRHASG